MSETWSLVTRFVLGGSVVASFAALAEVFKPKTFSGTFAAAPTVAAVSLAFAFHRQGAESVARLTTAMSFGGAALFVYGCLCVWTAQRRALPVWLGALLNWGAWLVVAFIAWSILTRFNR
ncbi:MAG TPA: DUF3147 family protein [Polyangiaceae bacterium]|jgi:hypothetical protein|nr:DUF3147 family protein [Polyangiaceae bacterium]